MKKPPKKIVLIEDDPHTNKLLTDNLQMRNFEVISTFTGEEGLEAVRKHYPDLIMLDIILPGMDGWDVCRILRKESSELQRIPIVIISVVSQDESQSKGMGTITFLNKPFEIRGLIGEIEKTLGCEVTLGGR